VPLSPDQAALILSADAPARDLRIAQKAKKGLPLTHAERLYVQGIVGGDAGDANEPEYVTRNTDLARLLNVSRQRLHYHTRQPTFPKKDAAGRFKTADLLAYARASGLRGPAPAAAVAGNDAAEAPDLYTERALLTRAQRLGIEMQNRKAAGQLLELLSVEAAWDLIRSTARQRLLALPGRVESECNLAPADQKRVRAILDRVVDDVLTELAKPPDYQLWEEKSQTAEAP